MGAPLAAMHLHHHLHGTSLGYIGIALAVTASWAGVPGPGEPALIAGAVFAARGRLDLLELLAVAWLAAMLGGVGGWMIGRWGHALVRRPGPLHRHRLRALSRGERFFERYGLIAVYFAPSWVAGSIGFPARRFIPANAGAAAIWTALVGGGGYAVGPQIGDVVADAGLIGLLALGGLFVLGVARTMLRHHRKA
jgi:membrane protein DedA with SNARE-associated domain